MRRPESAELDWSASERYRVDAMLEAALVGSLSSVRTGLLDINRRCAPDEIMAMTDLPDAEMTMSSYIRLADLLAALPPMQLGGLSAPMDGRSSGAGAIRCRRGSPSRGRQHR
jgi:hypothetical protein